MPRFYNSDGDAIDLCTVCWSKNTDIIKGAVLNEGDINTDHPEYSDTDYNCDYCGKRLGDRDD